MGESEFMSRMRDTSVIPERAKNSSAVSVSALGVSGFTNDDNDTGNPSRSFTVADVDGIAKYAGVSSSQMHKPRTRVHMNIQYIGSMDTPTPSPQYN